MCFSGLHHNPPHLPWIYPLGRDYAANEPLHALFRLEHAVHLCNGRPRVQTTKYKCLGQEVELQILP